MSCEVIEAVREKIISRLARDSTTGIVWHAGEPTAAPIEWYEHAYSQLEPVRPPNSNFAMQTNGIAIDSRWIALFLKNRTDVSVSIDGPERFHNARRLTRNGKPTWHLALRGLKRLQDAGFQPRVITVLHPDGLSHAEEYFNFYQSNGIVDVSFSIDEQEGANNLSSFGGIDHKADLVAFLVSILNHAFNSGYALYIREVERIAAILAGAPFVANELIEPWASIVVAANGDVSTFSPEFMEVRAPEYSDFVFGNILAGDFGSFTENASFKAASREIEKGVSSCKSCRYFGICGGGSPVNKYCERKNLAATETEFCRLTTQASADALLQILSTKSAKVATKQF